MKNHTPRNPIFIAAIYGAAIVLLAYFNGLDILPDPYFYLSGILPIVWAAFVKPYRLSWELILILLAGASVSLIKENNPPETILLILLFILAFTSSSVAIIQRALLRHWTKEELLHKERNLAVDLSATHDLNFALHRCLEVSLEVTRLDSVGICLASPKDNLLELSNRTASNELATKLFQRLVQSPRICKKMMLGQPFYESTGLQQDKNKKVPQQTFFKVVGFIPIRHNDQTVGVFVAGSTRLSSLSPQARDAIESIAAQVGSSIMHIQGEVKLQESQKALQITRSRLEEVEARYRQMVEQVQAVIYLDAIDQERRAIYISPQVEVLLGYEQSEWMARPNLWQQLIHPDDKERVMAEHYRTNASGKSFRCEYRFYRRDGRILWVHDEASLVRHEEDNPAYWQGLMYDITDRKNAEEILACGMELFQSLMDNIPDTIFFKDTNSRFTQVNKALARFFGVTSSGDLIGKTEADFLDESLARESYQKEQAMIRTGRSLVNQVEFQPTRDGQKRWLSVTKFPMYDVNGNIVGIAGLSRDITDNVRTQEALEKRLLALTRPLDDAASLNFEDLFNVKDIQAVQDAFSAATGVASVILDVRGYSITRPSNYCDLCNLIRSTPQGMKDCFRSDFEFGRTPANGPLIQKCILNGLLMSSASIMVGDHHIANWMVGQVREDNGYAEDYRRYAQTIGVDEEVYLKALDKAPRMSRQQFELIAQAHYLIAGQLSRLAIQNIQQAQEIVERKRLEYELRFVNTHDALTGLYNRTFFEAEMSRLQPSRQYPVSIIMIDVDGLKKTNDHLGHSAGDELLKEAAQIMRSAFRAEDVVARIGGDEFAVILPGTNAQIAQVVVGRLRSYLDAYNHQPNGLTVRLSIGVATGEKGGTLDAILHQADALMYADKRRGRMNQPA